MNTIDPPVPPLPLHNEPQDLPADRPDRAPNVLVHTELGVPIHFNPTTREFSANLGPSDGRGSESRLHSQDFSLVLSRIRQRCLVVPVEAYLVSSSTYRSQPTVEVKPCTVLEYHPRRQNPYVVSAVNTRTYHNRQTQQDEITRTRQIYATANVYLPTPEQIDRLRDAVQAVKDEEERHQSEMLRLRALAEQAHKGLTTLDPRTIKTIQETRRQQAIQSQALGAVVYDLRLVKDEGEDDNEENASNE